MMNIKRIGILLIILIIFVVVLLGIMFIFREQRIDVHEIGSLELNCEFHIGTYHNLTGESIQGILDEIENNKKYVNENELQQIRVILQEQNPDANIVISRGRKLKYIRESKCDGCGMVEYFGVYEEAKDNRYYFYTVDCEKITFLDAQY